MLRLYIVGVYGEKEMHGGGASRGSDAGGGTMNRMHGGMDAGKETRSICMCTRFSTGPLSC